MKCTVCSKEYEAKRSTSKYCSSQCRKLAFQSNGKVSVPADNEVSVPQYETVPDAKVYGRQAVRYPDLAEAWEFRPEPIHFLDIPKPLNRGKYTRPDGSEYQFDCRGRSFDLTNGKVYQTIDDVRACYAEAQAQ